jgi:hypothetical protein
MNPSPSPSAPCPCKSWNNGARFSVLVGHNGNCPRFFTDAEGIIADLRARPPAPRDIEASYQAWLKRDGYIDTPDLRAAYYAAYDKVPAAPVAGPADFDSWWESRVTLVPDNLRAYSHRLWLTAQAAQRNLAPVPAAPAAPWLGPILVAKAKLCAEHCIPYLYNNEKHGPFCRDLEAACREVSEDYDRRIDATLEASKAGPAEVSEAEIICNRCLSTANKDQIRALMLELKGRFPNGAGHVRSCANCGHLLHPGSASTATVREEGRDHA